MAGRGIKTRFDIGPSSQQDFKTNSSVCVSVLDLKQKINGLERQLNTVSKHCQDLACLESRLKLNDNESSEKDSDKDKEINKIPGKEILSKLSMNLGDTPNTSKSLPKVIICEDEGGIKVTPQKKMFDQNYSYYYNKNRKNKCRQQLDPIQENDRSLRSRRNLAVSKTLPTAFSKTNCHSLNEFSNYNLHLDACYPEVNRRKNRNKMKYLETDDGVENIDVKENRCEDQKIKNHKYKYCRPQLDHDFIADIIRRQYSPVKLFGRRESDFSQFSAPVCRDQEFTGRKTVREGSDLCSCCFEEKRHHRHCRCIYNNDVSDIRSMCDTRLYSSKKHKHHTHCKKRPGDFYNDSDMYDIIPVKEKASPKSRNKNVQDKLIKDKHREVPPSPRTQRPRLNLQAQYYSGDDNDGLPFKKQIRPMQRLHQNEEDITNMSSEVFTHNRNFNRIQNSEISNKPKLYNKECIGTERRLLIHDKAVTNNDTTLNTQVTDVSADKTDKALSEIRDILQNFLQEIKKESLQNEKFNSFPEQKNFQHDETQNQIKNNNFNNTNSFGSCGSPAFIQPLPNSCYYPILPVCPMNCVQNGYVIPSSSFTCAACINNSKERTSEGNLQNRFNSSEEAKSETQKMIKEIHNLLSQTPNSIQKKEFRNDSALANDCAEKKKLTSRSVGGSSKLSKHDAKIGTSKIKSHSRSCEAIGSREVTDELNTANVSYSDTVLEKGSGEEVTTESFSESEYSSESTVMDKNKETKFTKILRSIGFLKNNKRDVFEELSESESNLEVHKPKQRPPFQQHIINYNVHEQEYLNPHMNPNYQQHRPQYEYCGSPNSHYDPKNCNSPIYINNKMKNPHVRRLQEQNMQPHCMSPHHITVPPYGGFYDPHYYNVSPQVPVCLKEIEVKSIGTQSIRKISLLQKLTNKMQVPVQQAKEPSPKHSSTRTTTKNTNNLFDWKKIHEKAMQKTTDPLKFSFKTQKRLADGDNTMRNVMLKKLFYKRNPFSPRNLLVRTLLGKDKSSFGEPPKMYKPRMFL